jgi:hypothetical protein
MYIKLAWGGPAEQEAEHEAGNPFAKDWQDEAWKILENMVCFTSLANTIYLMCIVHRWSVITRTDQLQQA